MAEPLAALIVELRLESAKFQAEMESAGQSTKNLGGHAGRTHFQLARFAAIATQEVVPGLHGMRVGLEQVFLQLIKAKGAFSALGPAAAIVGTAIGGFLAGNFLANFRELGNTTESFGERLKVAAGFTGGFEERLRKAAEAQKAFGAEMSKSRDLLRTLDIELAELQGNTGRALTLRSEGQEAGAIGALGGAKATAALDRIRQIRVEQERKAFEEQQKLRVENEQKVLDQLKKERDEQLKSWQTETQFLADELKTRLKLRQDFEAQLGQGGLPGQDTSAAGGLAAVRRLQQQIEKEARDVAFLEREGTLSQTDSAGAREDIRTRALDEARRIKEQFGGLPVVIDAVNRAIQSVEFGNLGKELAKARTEIQTLAPTLDSLLVGLGKFAGQLATIPRAADPTSIAIRQLSQDYVDLGNAVFFVVGAQNALTGEGPSRAALPNTGIQVVE